MTFKAPSLRGLTLDYLLFGDESGHAKDVDCIPDLAEFLSAQGAEVSAEPGASQVDAIPICISHRRHSEKYALGQASV